MKIPDNYQFYREHESMEQDELLKFPVCDCCEDPIKQDTFFLINGFKFCEQCLKDEFERWTEDYMK